MRNQINSGFPVIYAGRRTSNGATTGHMLIAYGVDETNDILLHTGWKENEHKKISSTEYNLDRSIIWLEINEENLPHMCSDAYYDIHTDSYMCACEVYCGTHPEATHVTGTGYVSYIASGHYKACVKCGEAVALENHTFTHVPCNNNNYHRSVCACGYETTSAHIVNSTSGKIGTCTVCGASVFIGNGTIMPWGSNEEDELY